MKGSMKLNEDYESKDHPYKINKEQNIDISKFIV